MTEVPKDFKPTTKPIYQTEKDAGKGNEGWAVYGIQNFTKTASGSGHAQAGYLFETQKEAQEFYEQHNK